MEPLKAATNLTLTALIILQSACIGYKDVFFLDTTPPSTPLSLSAGNTDVSKVTLTWIASTDDVTLSENLGYEICMSASSGGCDNFTKSFRTQSGATTYLVQGLTSYTRYFFRIRSIDAAGNVSTNSNEDNAYTNPASAINNWPDTGQTLCYNTSSPIACTGSAGTFPYQDGDFTNIPAARSYTGPTAHVTYTSDYTTIDNTTGLVWKSCSEGLSGATCATGAANTFTWAAAATQCASLNALNAGAGFAGRTNWRLPTMPELSTLAYMAASTPAITSGSFPGTQDNYWSSSVVIANTTNAWNINFTEGTSAPNIKTAGDYLRCVSATSSSVSNSQFVDNGDSTIRDTKTNLTWQKCTRGLSGSSCTEGAILTDTWANSVTYCRNLSLAGRSWRLPSIIELRSIVDEGKYNPAINGTIFPMTASSGYWSSTTIHASNGAAWSVDFVDGDGGNNNKATLYRSRCVAL